MDSYRYGFGSHEKDDEVKGEGNDTLCVIFRNDQQSLQGIFRYRVASTIEQVAQCMNDGFKIAVAVC